MRARRLDVRRALAWGAITATLMGAGAACSIVLGTGSYTTCSAADDAGWYGADCLACVQANCCEQAAACARDPACAERERYLGQGVPILASPLTAGVLASLDTGALDAGLPASALKSCKAMSCGAPCGGPWACADRDAGWPQALTATATVTIDPTVYDSSLTSLGPPVTIDHVSLCRGAMQGGGANCSPPLPGGEPGPMRIPVDVGFTGYFDVVSKTLDGGDLPLEALVYLSWPIAGDVTIDLRLLTHMNAVAIAQGLTGGDGGEVDTTGTLVVIAKDCSGDPAAGVTLIPIHSLGADPFTGSDAFTFDENGMPAPQYTSSLGDAAPGPAVTGAVGVAGWTFLDPAHQALFSASAGGLPLVTQAEVNVKKSSLTYFWLTPTVAGP
jgi:hypothetical protein